MCCLLYNAAVYKCDIAWLKVLLYNYWIPKWSHGNFMKDQNTLIEYLAVAQATLIKYS